MPPSLLMGEALPASTTCTGPFTSDSRVRARWGHFYQATGSWAPKCWVATRSPYPSPSFSFFFAPFDDFFNADSLWEIVICLFPIRTQAEFVSWQRWTGHNDQQWHLLPHRCGWLIGISDHHPRLQTTNKYTQPPTIKQPQLNSTNLNQPQSISMFTNLHQPMWPTWTSLQNASGEPRFAMAPTSVVCPSAPTALHQSSALDARPGVP